MFEYKKYAISFSINTKDKIKCVEPIKRIKCLEHVKKGLRNVPETPRYIKHTYSIKGGITWLDSFNAGILEYSNFIKGLKNVYPNKTLNA
jgi:hypothetical protein